MDRYYYFVSQLPYLRFGYFPSFKRDDFLREAKKWLTQKDLCILLETDINNFDIKREYPLVLKKYINFEFNLRNQLSLYRKAHQKNKEYKLPEKLKNLIVLNTPLDVEKAFLEYRWNFLEEIEKGHYFDISCLIVFYLKFQILERLRSFNKEKGKEKFQEISQIEPEFLESKS